MFHSSEFSAIYISTYSNMATCMVGLAFGYVYFKFEDKLLFSNQLFIILWWTSFLGLPLFVIIVSSYEYGRITSAVISGILKPIYALGIGIGILGMSQKIGGIAKYVCEWKPALFLGNITYSTYVVHFGIVFYRTATASEPLQISDYILFTSFIRDAIYSFVCGFFMHLTLELPASQLQNIFIPKFKKNNTFIRKKYD